MTKNKSKSTSRTRALIKRIFNVWEWMDVERLQAGGQFIKDGVKRVFISSPKRPVESFDEAQRRLKLTDEALTSRVRSLFRLSIFMLCLAVALLIYTVYHFIFGTIHAGVLTFVLSLISLAFAFRYHFWYFQIKSRKLGCTLSEWFYQGLMGGKS